MEPRHKAQERSGHFEKENRDFSRLCMGVIKALQKMIKTACVHDANNEVWDQLLGEFGDLMGRLNRQDEEWEIKVRHDYLYFSDLRLKAELEEYGSYHYVLDALRQRGIGSLSVRQASRKGLLAFLFLLAESGQIRNEKAAFQHLRAGLEEKKVRGIKVAPLEEDGAPGGATPSHDIRKRSMITYFKALFLVREMLASIDARQLVNMRLAKKCIASLLDILQFDESFLLGLTNIKNYDHYTFNHSLNVCIISLAVGRRLGLERHHLSQLGLSALFHDLGKVSLPQSVLNKPGKLDSQEWEKLRDHPAEGVKKLAQLKGLNDQTSKLLLSIFRHHVNLDRSGYPPCTGDEVIPLFARIIRIVDSYDAMTTDRVYRKKRLNNIEALENLWNHAGNYYDPALLKIFISVVGIYPIGSMVQLSDGMLAVVTKNHLEVENLVRPRVYPVTSWEQPAVPGEEIDLSTQPQLEICGYYPNSEFKFSTLGYLFKQ